MAKRQRLTIKRILAWADAHHRRTGGWPTWRGKEIPRVPDETWREVDACLGYGGRGLRGGTSLAEVFFKHRGVRDMEIHPKLSVKQILEWADAYRARTGHFPRQYSGPVEEAPTATWSTINRSLTHGGYGCRGGSSLSQFLVKHRGHRNKLALPHLTIKQILEWADNYHRRAGKWPTLISGSVHEAPGETWNGISTALAAGGRGLAGDSTLAQLLKKHRGRRMLNHLPNLTVPQILKWADGHHRRTGHWPHQKSGTIPRTHGETWGGINQSLTLGRRGLRTKRSLARILAQHRGVRNHMDLAPLRIKKILAWAKAYQKRTGQWPTVRSGSVTEAPDENWSAINAALRAGVRGLPGDSSLPRLLEPYRRKRHG